MLEKSFTKLPVIFKNVKTIKQTFLPRNSVTSLVVNICRTSGYFEIHLKDELVPVSTGWIFVHKNVEGKSLDNVKSSLPDQYKLKLTSDDFYKFMHLRGFNYDGLFLGVQECDFVGRAAVLKWNENWIAFIDTIIHYVLGVETREHCLPTRFEEIVIHPEKHFKCVALNTLLKLSYDEHIKSVKCGGIEIKHIVGMNVKRHHSGISPVVGRYAFVKNYDTQREMDSFIHSINVVSQIVTENSVENLNIKIAETDSDKATEILRDMMERVSFKRTTFHKIGPIGKEIDDHYDLLITQDIKPSHMKFIENCSNKVRFIFGKVQNLELTNFEVIYQHVTESGTYVLLQRWVKLPEKYTVINVNNNNLKWIEDLKAAISKEQNQHSRIYLVNEDINSGIVGLFNSIRQEHICPNLRIFFIRGDKNMEPFSLRSKFYLEQVRKDMTVNVYQNNSWGTYRFLPLQLSESRLYRNACLIKDNNNVQWMQSSPYLSDRKVTVKCASINELDFLVVNGKAGFYPGDEHLGLEYSGVNKDGITVMGLVQKGAVATSVEAHPYLTWNIPSGLTFEEAATIPLAYTLVSNKLL
jgi:fatty acid synthase